MLNAIWMLTDNGLGDGEMVVLPGSHRAHFPVGDHLNDEEGKRSDALCCRMYGSLL